MVDKCKIKDVFLCLKIGSNDQHDDLSQQFVHHNWKRHEEKHAHSQGIIWRFSQIHPKIVDRVLSPWKEVQPIPTQLPDYERKLA